MLFCSQEFPEKTRPVSFKHPAFRCPDMSPSPSVPSSGLSGTTAPYLKPVSDPAVETSHSCHHFHLLSLLPPFAPVEFVKAADIKVIAALGDSLTVRVKHCS